ncbi:MAG: hypothetical protein LBH00_05990 [Planctomycetaceae bacterium]|jgi:hypothetical protein|nr:hypothetical protein [Planctomycetaceae bacterium]
MTKPKNPSRRKVLRQLMTGGAALAGGAAFISNEEYLLAQKLAGENKEGGKNVPKKKGAADTEVDGLSGASRTHTNWGKLSELKKKMSAATIKGIDFSRIIMGGNLVGGWAHARDLMYVSELVKAYHTRDKVIATFKMAEACGVNAYIGHESHIGILTDYWEKADGSIQFIADSHSLDGALKCLDKGATACYLYGELCDKLVREGNFDPIVAFIERLRKEKAVVGIGGHRIGTIKVCAEKGIEPDFWMKTIHHHNYWSRMPDKKEQDNVYCHEPEETIAVMHSLKQPWLGFKVLAAGAIPPKDGFRYAFEAGADFLCVGMYDFQIVNDVNICMDILQSKLKRQRPWCFT